MALNPGGTTTSWNYSKPDKEGFSTDLVGTVVSVQEVQAREFNMGSNQPGRPRFWPSGNPVFNIRMGFAMEDGSLKTFTFAEAGKEAKAGRKFSTHMLLYGLLNNMEALVGKTVHLWTWPAHPETGQPWGQGNPRQFGAELVDGVTYQLNVPLPDELLVPELLCNDAVAGGQPVAPAPYQMQQPQVPPMQGQFYAPPAVQYSQQQYVPQQQQQFQPQQYQPPINTAPMPTGMDPAVMAAMQTAGATNVQPYDDIPF